MIKEIVQFTKKLDEPFKAQGLKPKEGLHIMLFMKQEGEVWQMDAERMEWEHYSKKDNEISPFLSQCMQLQLNAWMIDTNKCFDTPTKAIHSCSPFCAGFKREHLEGGKKYASNASREKTQIHERMPAYFSRALELVDEEEKERLKVFRQVFTDPEHPLYFLKTLTDNEKYKDLSEGDYIIFYLKEALEAYKAAHENYLAEKLFNTANYNTPPDDTGRIYGTNNFFNGYNSSMPFLMHQTATFDISGRISNEEAKSLFEFQQILPRKTLPNPLPVFLFEEELGGNSEKETIQGKVIGLFNKSGNRIGYKEIIENLWSSHKEQFANYYLLNYQNTKDGLVFNDFDYVAKFEYELLDSENQPWRIHGLFENTKSYDIGNIFEFQNKVVRQIFNNQLIVKGKEDSWRYKYFDEIEAKYCKSARNHLNILKFRKAFYEFIYKSKRQAVTKPMFDEMMTVSILEDIRLDRYENQKHSEYFNIREKLNIWFSLYEKFSSSLNQNKRTMVNQLEDHLSIVSAIAEGKKPTINEMPATFAFIAGQAIRYIFKKSKSGNKSYQRLEPYLQKVQVAHLKEVMALEFAKYKHENYSRKFENVFAWLMDSKEELGDPNVKKLLPELLAGFFAENKLYSNGDKSEEDE